MSISQHKSFEGFTLLEVMIALLILSIGLLGLAHLQITTLKHNQSAGFRSQASTLATDMLDRMRANQTAAQDDKYKLNLDADAPEDTNSMAKADLSRWLAKIDAVLPQGDGAINCNAFNPDEAFICNVTISWTEVQEDGDLGTTNFIYSGAL